MSEEGKRKKTSQRNKSISPQLIFACVVSRIMEAAAKKLISLVKNRPNLYNNSYGHNKNKALNDLLWKEIATEMGCTENYCRRQWATFRNCYARVLRDKRSKKRKKKTWYLEEDLSFLNGYIYSHRKSKKETIKITPIQTDCISERSPLSYKHFLVNEPSEYSRTSPLSIPNNHESNGVELVMPLNPIISIDDDDEKPKMELISPTDECSISKRSFQSSDDYMPTFLVNELSMPTQGPIETFEKTTSIDCPANDSNRLFLQSLLSDMNRLSEKKQRMFKRKTLELMEFLFDSDDS